MALPETLNVGLGENDGTGDRRRDAFVKIQRCLNDLDFRLDQGGLNKANLGHTPVSDANYQVIATDVDVAFITLTAPRTVKLCDVDTYPLGQDLVIGDESGSCSATNTITILVGDGTSDTIPQQSDGAIVLGYAFASVRLRRGAANIWKIV